MLDQHLARIRTADRSVAALVGILIIARIALHALEFEHGEVGREAREASLESGFRILRDISVAWVQAKAEQRPVWP